MMLRYDPKKLQEKLHGPYPIVKIQTNGTVSLQRRPGISERIIQYKKTMTLQRPLTKRQDNKLLTVNNRRDNTDALLKNKDYYYQTQQDQSKILNLLSRETVLPFSQTTAENSVTGSQSRLTQGPLANILAKRAAWCARWLGLMVYYSNEQLAHPLSLSLSLK